MVFCTFMLLRYLYAQTRTSVKIITKAIASADSAYEADSIAYTVF